MNTQTSSAAILAMLFVLCGGLVPSARADALSEAFSNPPPSARPHTWYHLMNGNVTKAGITRDFEALARLGIGGVQMFDAGCAIPPGDLKFNSPEWFDMFRHAAAEARRLGLELCIPNCSGWSSSGGPWNTPTNAMKMLCCREIALRGPRRFADVLPRDAEDNGFYADIAVVAFPTPPAEQAAYPQVRTTLEKDGFTLAADEPFEARGMSFRLDYPIVWTDRLPVTVSVSQDGHTFAPLEDYMEILAQHGVCDRTLRYHAFPAPVKVRAIRARFGKAKVKCVAKEAHPEAKLAISSLRAKTFAFRDEFPTPRDTAIATPAQVVPGDKVVDLTGKMSADGKLEWDVPPGDWTVVRVGYKCNGRCNHPASEKGKGLEVDKLSAAALDYHIDQYVTKLCRHLGPLAGAVESGFNNVLVDSYEVGSQNWTQGFEKTFEKRMGYSLLRYLPVFAGRIVGSVDETERFLEDFRRTVADEFTANYSAALARKCHSLGLKLSLEPYGNCPADNLQYGEFADIPMGELWSHANEGNFNTDEGNARVPAYVAHVWGRKIAATESFTTAAQPYGSGRWLTTPFALKAQCDRIYARGVNRIIYHRFAHQPWADDRYLPGMTMGLYGMHFDRTQTWWNFAGGWIRYQTRCQAMLQAGEYVADALFYCGGEAPNQGGNPGGHRQFGDNPDLMLPPGYSWDVCPKSAFMRLAVKDGRVVAPGGLSYPLLVLPPNDTMGADELEQLVQLLAAGAKVCGRVRPTRAPGLSGGADADGKVAARARQVWAQGVMELQPVEALAKLGLGPDFAAPGMVMDGDTGLAFTHRRAAAADWYFVAMPNRGPVSFEASFRISGRIPEIWDAEKGTIQRAREWREENGHTVVRLDFQTSGSAFVVFREKTPPDLPVEKRYDLVESLAVKGPWNVAFPNGFRPNALAEGPDEIVEFPVLSDWKDHANEGIRYFSGTATYKCRIENVKSKMEGAPGKDRVVLDLGDVREVAEVTVNGKTYPALWKPPYRVDITDALRVVSNASQGGTNISIEVRVANLWPNRLIGDDRTCADDCEWNEWGGVVKIPDWVKRGEKSPTGRLTFTTWKHWKKNDPLQPSGLLGPVSLRLETEAPPTGSAAFRSRKRILEKPLVVTQTQFYPLREQPRGYLGRYANQPLMIDPDLPEDPNREGIGDFPGWGNFHSQADYDLTLQAIKDSGLDGAAIFAARHRRFFSSAADCPVQGSVVVPILLLSSPNVTNDFSDIENVLANPRNFKIGGKILCLSYRMSQSSTPELLKAKLAAIREKYGDRFLFVCALAKPAQMWHVFEGNGRMMSVQLRRMIEDETRAYARVADGISIGEAHMLAKFENGERAFGEMFWRQIHEIVAGVLAEPEFNGKKLFCSSAVNAHMNPTWNGHNTAENGTRTLRDSLGSAIAAGVDAILLPEWDEFNENTCFCPTLYGSFATRRILRHCVSAAKGCLPEPMPGDDATRPNLIVSYRKTLTPGELLAIEVLNVPDGTRRGMLALEVELTDEKGTPVKTFDKALVDEGTFAELRFEVDTATLAPKVRCAWVRLRWRNGANGGALEEGLHPIDLVPGGEWSHLCVKQPIRDIVRPKKADVSLREGRMAADFALDEPIRYAMLCGDGCIQAIAGRPGSAPDRFREDESNAVFQITGFSCAQSFKAKKGREHSCRVRGCAEAEWLCMKDTVRGERFTFDVLHGNGCAPQVFLRMPKAKLKGAVLRCDFPNVWRCEIPLDEAFRLGAYGADCAGRGLQVTVARFMRQSRYPSVANDRTCAFDLPVDADRNSMAYHVQLVTMRGKVWYSRPFVSEKQGGASTMSVWDVMREAVVPVALPSSRVPHLEYDFSPVAGTVVLPRSGERHWMGMLGGPFTPATLWNRGSLTVGAVRSHSPFRRDPKRKSVPARQQEPDGSWSLVFDGVDDYVGFPWTVIPSFAGFTVEMDVFPESRADGKPGSLLSSDLALRNLGLDAQGELVLSYVGMPRCDRYRTGLRLQAGKWSHLRLVCTGDSLNLSVDGETAGPFPIGLPGISTTPLTLGGSPKPDRGFFKGRIRNLSIDHAVARSFSVEALPDAKPWEKTAAQELRDYLGRVALDGKITVGGLGDVVFHVGDTAFAAGKGMSSADFKNEEWAIKSFGRDVVLNGGGTRGCLYAVYHFLEDFCDIRWWMDGDEDVPPTKPLALPALDRRGKPHFFYRDVYRSKKDDFRTAVRNRLNGNGDNHISPAFGGGEVFGPPYHCHTWRMHIPWAKYGKDHPEWFALVNGKRTGHKRTQLCLSCPDLPAVMAARIEEQIAKGEAEARARGLPPPRLYDMSMNDGHGFCECAPCKASQEKYGVSGDQLIFENKVAAMLAAKHPDLLFSVFAYYEGEVVPKNGVRAADNIVVKLCNTRQNMAAGIFEPDNKFMHDQVQAWRSYAKNLFVWEYTITFRKETTGFPFASEFYLGEKLRYYADNGVMGLLVEHERPEKNDFYELKYHILARFLENPYLDAQAVTEDFMRRYYGAAAPHLMESRRYLDSIRRKRNGFVTWFPIAPEFAFVDGDDCSKMAAMWDKAEAAVKDDAKRLARVRRARRGFDDMRTMCAAAQRALADAETGVSDVPFMDFTAEKKAFTLHDSRIAYVDDPEAKGGKAVHVGYLSEHLKMPFQMGVYSQALRKTVRCRSWKTPLGEGYHWYELGKFEFPKVPAYIFLTRSWTIQVVPWDRRILGMTGNVKAHVKFTPEGIWVDRVVIIPNN